MSPLFTLTLPFATTQSFDGGFWRRGTKNGFGAVFLPRRPENARKFGVVAWNGGAAWNGVAANEGEQQTRTGGPACRIQGSGRGLSQNFVWRIGENCYFCYTHMYNNL